MAKRRVPSAVIIEEAMKDRGLTVGELARESGVHQSQISRLLSGDRDLNSRAYVALCRALGIGLRIDSHEREVCRPPDNLPTRYVYEFWGRLADKLNVEERAVIQLALDDADADSIAVNMGISRREAELMLRMILRKLAQCLEDSFKEPTAHPEGQFSRS